MHDAAQKSEPTIPAESSAPIALEVGLNRKQRRARAVKARRLERKMRALLREGEIFPGRQPDIEHRLRQLWSDAKRDGIVGDE